MIPAWFDEQIVGPFVQSPALWALVFVSSIPIVWVAFSFVHKERLAALQEKLQLRDEQIQAYKNKLHGATPNEAAIMIAELKKQVAEASDKIEKISPKRITHVRKEAMISALAIARGSRIRLTKDGVSSAISGLVADLTEVFENSGWIVEQAIVIGIGNPPPTGIRVSFSRGVLGSVPAQALVNAFRAGDIDYDLGAEILPYPNEPEVFSEILLTTPR